MATVNFEKQVYNVSPTYRTYFFNDNDVDFSSTETTITPVFVPRYTGDTTAPFDTARASSIRNVEAYKDDDDDNLSNGLAKYKWLDTDSYPSELNSDTIYIRRSGTTIVGKTGGSTISNCIVVIVTD